MPDCIFQPQLAAFHDGELDGESANRFESHLPGCGTCAKELAQFSQMSHLFAAKGQAEMLPLELARLHSRLDNSAIVRPSESDFLRTAGMLSALAASILIVSSVWLFEFPSRHAAALSPGVAVVPALDFSHAEPWERTAITLRVDPLPQSLAPDEHLQFDQTGLADARDARNRWGDSSVDAQVADWMVAGLNSGLSAGGAGHANP